MELQTGLALRSDTIQSVGSSTLGHSQGATSTPDAALGTSSTLLERARCNFGMLLTYDAFGPVSVLQGRGRNVGSIHAGACFVSVRKVQQDSLLRHIWDLLAHKIGTKRA